MAYSYKLRRNLVYNFNGTSYAARILTDGFESGNLNDWCDPSASGYSEVVTAAARTGTYGLRQVDFDFIAAVDGQQTHPGPYPKPGNRWEFYARFPTSTDAQNGLSFHAFGVATTDASSGDMCSSTDAIGNHFEVQHRRGTNEIRIYDTVAGASSTVDLSVSNYPADEWIRTEVEWDDSTSPNTIRAEAFDSAGNSLTGGTKVTYSSDNMAANRGFGFRNSGGETMHWDDFRILDRKL